MPVVTYPLWVHGHTMNIESPERIHSSSRVGSFGRILGNPDQNTWVHFSVPAPYFFNGVRLPLEAVMVRFRTTPSDAWIAGVHVFESETRIASFDDLHDAPGTWTTSRFALPAPRSIQRAVGISINVKFQHDSGATPSWRIDFSSVGCNFVRST